MIYKQDSENDFLIYGKSYHCWREGRYIGIAVYTDDDNIGDCFLRDVTKEGDECKRVEVFSPDKWEFVM